MSIIKVDYGTISGGSVKSGTTVKVSGSEVSAVTSTSTEFTVETGVTNLKKFILYAAKDNADANYQQYLCIDNVNRPNKFSGLCTVTTNTATASTVKINSDYTSTAHAYVIVVSSISADGTITCKTCTGTGGTGIKDIVWYAE